MELLIGLFLIFIFIVIPAGALSDEGKEDKEKIK
jgi:hypothetical protein